MTRRTLSACIVAFMCAAPLTVAALVSGTEPAGPANGSKKVVLKLAHALPAAHPVHASLQSNEQTIAAAGRRALVVSQDGGATWHKVTLPPNVTTLADVTVVVIQHV